MTREIRLKTVTFRLWVDVEQYTDPSTWPWNDIFGFKSISVSGATITRVDVVDGGTLTDHLAEKKRCRQQKT